MAETLQSLLGNPAFIDEHLRERAGRDYDAMTPAEQRAAFIQLVPVVHEITYTLQMARDGHSAFKDDRSLLNYIQALALTTDSLQLIERHQLYNRLPEHGEGYYCVVNAWLLSRGYEAEPKQVIDALRLPDDIRRQAEEAGTTPRASPPYICLSERLGQPRALAFGGMSASL